MIQSPMSPPELSRFTQLAGNSRNLMPSIAMHRTSMYSRRMVPKTLVAASSRPLVLSILARGESYGYAIIHEVKSLSEGQIEWTDGMLYPVLHRLERENLIESRWGESDTGRKRKYYQLTAAGGTALSTERKQWMNVHNTLAQLWGIKSCPT